MIYFGSIMNQEKTCCGVVINKLVRGLNMGFVRLKMYLLKGQDYIMDICGQYDIFFYTKRSPQWN